MRAIQYSWHSKMYHRVLNLQTSGGLLVPCLTKIELLSVASLVYIFDAIRSYRN